MGEKVIVSGVAVVLLLGIFYFFYAHFGGVGSGDADFPTGLTVAGQSRYAQLKACVDGGQDLNACRLTVGVLSREEFEKTAMGGGDGGAVRITGQGNTPSVDCSAYSQLRSPTGSFEAWVKFDQEHLNEVQDIMRVYKNQGEELYVAKAADGRIWVLIRDWVNNNQITYVNIYSTGVVTGANWHHLVVAQDGQRLKMYLDSTLQEELKGSVNSGTWTNFLDMGAPRAGCALGYSGTGMDGKKFYGLMDEVRFYNQGLSDEEVRNHYQGIFPDRDERLVAHWVFDSKKKTA